MTRLALGLFALLVFAACDSVGPIATVGATRLAWDAKARGDGWSAAIDNPKISLSVDGRTATVPVAYEDTRRGRVYSGAFQGAPFELLLGPGPCALGPEGTPPQDEFVVTLTVDRTARTGCGSRPWVIGYKPPA